MLFACRKRDSLLHKGNSILRIFAALSMGEFVKDKYRKDARGSGQEK